jgi:O-antigen ligase
MLGRADSDVTTLTERTPLWHELIKHYITERPLTGYGYGAFWSTKHVVALSLLRKGSVYFHSHSGYLEMALSLGVIGAAVHVITLLLGIKRLTVEYVKDKSPGDAFGAALLITLMVSMFTEATNMSSYLMPTFLDMVFLANAAFLRRPNWRTASHSMMHSWIPTYRVRASL